PPMSSFSPYTTLFRSYPTFGLLRKRNQVFSELFAWAARGMNLGIGGEVEPVGGLYVTGNYYSSLGVASLLGRTLTPEDDRPAAPDRKSTRLNSSHQII